jgi:hypothetical protein
MVVMGGDRSRVKMFLQLHIYPYIKKELAMAKKNLSGLIATEKDLVSLRLIIIYAKGKIRGLQRLKLHSFDNFLHNLHTSDRLPSKQTQ